MMHDAINNAGSDHVETGGLQLVFGLVDEVKHSPILRIRAMLPDMGGMISPWAQVLTPRSQNAKNFDPPVVGEQVALLLMDDAEFALCLGSVFSEEDTSPASKHQYTKVFDDGTRIDYDPETHTLSVQAVGELKIVTDAMTQIHAPTTLIKSPLITLDGNTVITKGLRVAFDAVIGNKPFLPHTHGGVITGGSTTLPPT